MNYREVFFWIFISMILWAPLFTIFNYAQGPSENELEKSILNLRESSSTILKFFGFIFYIILGKLNRWLICISGLFFLFVFKIGDFL